MRTKSKALSLLFGSEARVRILSWFLSHPDEVTYLRELCRTLNLQPSAVRRELQRLAELDLIRRSSLGKRIDIRVNRGHPIFPELKAIFLKTAGFGDLLHEAIADESQIEVAFIYGSVAKGDETSTSDIDVALIGETSLRELASKLAELESHIGREINLSIFTVKEWRSRLESGDHFATTLLREPKILLIGTEIELRESGRTDND